MPVKDLTEAFQAGHLGVTFETEASGSNAAARKISELGREADLMMSADYTVIDELLIPDFAGWNVQFARNTMVVAYTDQSKYAGEIDADNWYEVLTRDGVIYGHSEPDADPCGYRTLLVWQLAEAHYGVEDLNARLEEHCPPENVRPKSVELIALLESGDMDYAWEYRSVAVQHGLKFVELPDEINLSMVEQAGFYGQATVDIAGKEPGTTMTMVGKPIVYGVTIPKNAPNPDLALEFVKFLLGPEGQAIMAEQGQPPIVPHSAAGIALLMVFGRRTLLGRAFGLLGLKFVSAAPGIVIAMLFVSLSFLVNAAREGFEAVDPRLERVARTLGASPWRIFWQIAFPLAWRSILSGMILMWARGLSEFGAVVILAYHPMVAPVLLYERFESFGLNYSRPVAALMILICLATFVLLRLTAGRKEKRA